MEASSQAIDFHIHEVDFELTFQEQLTNWLGRVAKEENKKLSHLEYILCNDDFLLALNRTHLNHETYTDVITFDHSDGESISGEVYISIDRVKENALEYNQTIDNELNRVMVHGLLHLIGYKDKSIKDKKEMTAKEDYYLSLRTFD